MILQWGIGIICVSILLASFMHVKWLSSSTIVFQSLIELPLASLTSISRTVHSTFISLAIKPSKFDEMQKTIAQLQMENDSLKNLRIENDIIREQLLFKKRDAYTLVHGHVIGMSSETGTNLMVIDRGSSEGVERGNAVTTANGIYVGYIAHTSNSTSYVVLPNNEKSAIIASIIKDTSELSGIVRGSFRAGLILDRVEQKTPLVSGDIIMTSSLNTSIPPGLLIGSVNEIRSTPNDLFQQTTITPAQNYDTIRTVSIIIGR